MGVFEKIDNSKNYKSKEERLIIANKAGYKFISEHVVEIYRKTKSLRKTGRLCGNITTTAVKSILDDCNEPIGKQGGKTYSKLTQKDVQYIKDYPYMNKRICKKVAKELGVTALTVQNARKGKTHAGDS